MNHEDMLREMHIKSHAFALSSKLTIQSIICVTMTYESICSTVRSVTATRNVVYVPHTMTEYLALIDRPAHLTHVAAVTATVVAGHGMPATIPYSEDLADSHDQLQNAFNSHAATLLWDVVNVGTGAPNLNVSQSLKVSSSLATLIQHCHANLANAFYTALYTPEMTAYHYLTSLDFVKDASGCKTHFGRIPPADVRFPHLQLFPKLAEELFKVVLLLGSSNNTYTIFTSSDIHLGLVHYTTQIDNWFDTVVAYNFATTADFLD